MREPVDVELGRSQSRANEGLLHDVPAPLRSRDPPAVDEERLLDRVTHAEAAGRATRKDPGRSSASAAEPVVAPVPRGPVSSWPRKRIAPASGSTIRITDCAVVVFPQPDSPTSASISPSRPVKETPSTAWTRLFGRRRRATRRCRAGPGTALRGPSTSRSGAASISVRRHDASTSAGSFRWQAAS